MIHQLTDRCIAVDVPADTVAWEMYDKEALPLAVLIFRNDPQGLFKPGIPEPIFPIPPGNWTILGRPHQIKGEHYKSIMGEDEDNLFEFLELNKVDHYGVIILIKQ